MMQRKTALFSPGRLTSFIFTFVYSSSFGAFPSSVFFSSVFANSDILGTISFQNATLSAWYLVSTLGFISRTRYSCSWSVNLGHVTGVVPESGGFGDLREGTKIMAEVGY